MTLKVSVPCFDPEAFNRQSLCISPYDPVDFPHDRSSRSSNASISSAVYRLVSQNKLQHFSDWFTDLQYKDLKRMSLFWIVSFQTLDVHLLLNKVSVCFISFYLYFGTAIMPRHKKMCLSLCNVDQVWVTSFHFIKN